MTTQAFEQRLADLKQVVEQELLAYCEALETEEKLKEAMTYSLMAGGKRIRPILLLLAIHALGKSEQLGLSAATALEMIHTYSLIHDDLPAMDDDDLRRGKPTNHIIYGEAFAILAGDALLTNAFDVLARDEQLSPSIRVHCIQELAQASGSVGMVSGQAADLLGEEKKLTIEQVVKIHERKTGALLKSAVRMGAIIAQATEHQQEQLTNYAYHLGLAFQIKDDLLDVIGDEAKIGKPVGSDEEKQKNTFVSLLGVDGAQSALEQHIHQAQEAIQKAEVNGAELRLLAEYLLNRES